RLIKELRGLHGTDEKFESKAAVLKESVVHHADEEEKDLFPAAEREFDDDRLRELGLQMAALKSRLTASEGHRAQRSARKRKAGGLLDSKRMTRGLGRGGRVARRLLP